MRTGIFNKVVVAWCAYDGAIAAFPVIVTTFIFSTYFSSKIASNAILGTEQWGIAMAIAAAMVALLAPGLGAMADHCGRQKMWLAVSTAVLMISCALLWFAYPTNHAVFYTLSIVVLGVVAFNIAQIFYSSMLLHITTAHHWGKVSGIGWGVGYLAGLCVLLIAYFGFVHHSPDWLSTATCAQIRICGPLVALWIFFFACPLWFYVPEYSGKKLLMRDGVYKACQQLRHGMHMVRKDKPLLIFLVAQMIYLDGLNTLFAFAGIYAAGTFHMSMAQVLMFGMAMNVSAGTGALLLAGITDRLGSKRTIWLSLSAVCIFSTWIVLIQQASYFWGLGCCISFFVGTIQAASRSYLVEMVLPGMEGMIFGLSALTGKISAFAGPLLVGFITAHFESQRAGMSSIMIFFVMGLVLLLFSSPIQSRGTK